MRLSRLLAGAGIVASLALPAAAQAKPTKPKKAPKPVEVQLLALNDFHGNLEPPTGSGGRIGSIEAGGAEYLATHLRQAERTARHSLLVSAGDLIGASPLLSAIFRDEPTIEAMNLMGLDLNAVGNHEFDDGVAELLRMQRGGCHPEDGCFAGTGFKGADFRFLAANVVWRDSGEPIFRPYVIRKFQGVRVGFIGMTLEGTPEIVAQEGIRDVRFLDEADTANRYAAELRRKGVEAIVVIVHEGGYPTGGYNECPGISGPIVDIVERTTRAVDLFITGHTHSAYVCDIDGRPVTSAASAGRLYTDLDLRIDKRTRDVIDVAKNNVIVTRDVARDQRITALIEHYAPFAAELAGRVVGALSAPAPRAPAGSTDPDESRAGKLIADSQLAATRAYGAQAAFMNPGGVRADFPAGTLTYGQIFTVQPFGNTLVTLTLTGEQVHTLLKQQWCGQSAPRLLLPSAGVTYTYDLALARSITGQPCAGAANPVSGLAIDGVPVDPGATYRITVNSFLAGGGDAFTVLPEGAQPTGGPPDLEALEAYLRPSISGDPIAPPTDDRVVVVSG
jgi:5'-nucleotidase